MKDSDKQCIGYILRTVFAGMASLFLSSACVASTAPFDSSDWHYYSHLANVHEGDAKREIVVFFDPNSPMSHLLYVWLQKPIHDKVVLVHFVPIPFLTKTSLGKAAAILSSTNPVMALQVDEDNFRNHYDPGTDHRDFIAGGGGIQPATTATIKKEIPFLQQNILVAEDIEKKILHYSFFGEPLILYKRDGEIQYHLGLPTNLTLASEIIGSTHYGNP